MNFLNAIQQKSLTAKITTMSSILTIVVAVALNCMFVAHEKKRIYGALEQRGLSLAKATAHGASSYVVARDRTALMGLLRGIEMEEDVAYVIIQDARGNVMAQTETGLESQALNRTSGETIDAVDGIETSLWKPSGQSSIYNVTVLASSRVSSRFDDEPDVGTLAEPNGGARSAQFGPANAATARVGISTRAAGEAFARSIMLAAVLTVLLIGLSVVVAARTIRMILSPLRSLLSCVQTTGEGDLTTKFSAAASNDEVGKLSDAFDKMQESLKSVVQQIQSSAELVDSSVSELSSSSRQQAAGANEQSTSLTETSSAVEELAAVSKQIAENAKKVAETAEQSLERMETIRENTALGANRIFTLGEKSQSIGEVVSMIDDITRQTNLLALNASIEAARAGAAGKGFAVVATEIRKLATNVAGSTDQIREIIKEIQNATNASVLATENITKSVESGIEMSKMAAESASHINMATQQQKSASDQMVTTIKEMVAIAKQTSSGARQIAETANKLSDATMVQKKLVSLFKIQ